MGVLYRTPEGLLDLTGQRVGGKYPQGLSDVVVPTLDLTHLLRGRLLSSETVASLTSALGDQASITVPDNETWLLFNLSAEMSFYAVGQDAELKVFLTKLPGSTDPLNKLILADFVWTVNRSPLGANAVSARADCFNPVAIPPGAQIVADVADCSEVNIPWSLHAGIYKLVGN